MVSARSLINTIVNFISNYISRMGTRFTGKQSIINTNAKRNTIQDLIDKAIHLNKKVSEATETQNDFNSFVTKMNTAKTKYDSFVTASNLYNKAVSDLRKLRRKRGNNQTLIGRAVSLKNRRRKVRDDKWGIFIVKIKQAGAAAITVLASYATLKSFRI